MRAPRALLGALAGLVLGLTGCTAAYDDDGEPGLHPAGAVAHDEDATPVVVDTDLDSDDLAALAYLLRRPDVRIVGVTIPATGMVGCDPGVDLVADLVLGLGEGPVPVACGRGHAAHPMPPAWRAAAARAIGLPRLETTFTADPAGAVSLLARLADESADDGGLHVVAIGPMTDLADLDRSRPDSYGRLAGVTAMAGTVAGRATGGVAEWNAAADPRALRAVLGGRVPVTVVPDDAVPSGTPSALATSAVASVADTADLPKWWDLAAAAVATDPGIAEVARGRWTADDAGRLRRTGHGHVAVADALDPGGLERAYATAFGR